MTWNDRLFLSEWQQKRMLYNVLKTYPNDHSYFHPLVFWRQIYLVHRIHNQILKLQIRIFFLKNECERDESLIWFCAKNWFDQIRSINKYFKNKSWKYIIFCYIPWIQVNNYEIVVNFFHISHNLTYLVFSNCT